MKIIIDLDEKYYDVTKKIREEYNHDNLETLPLIDAIANGTPLPKGHGDLIDRNELLKRNIDLCYYPSSYIRVAPTIIEADKVESEEDSDNLDSMLEDLWNATESEEEICSNNFIQLKQDVLNNKQLWRKLREIEDEDSD